MSDLIPIKIVNLALDAKDVQLKFLADENKRINDMLNDERAKIETLLKNNYRLRNAVMAAIDLMENGHSFTEDDRLRLQNQIKGSLV